MQQAAFKLSTDTAAEELALPPESSLHRGGSALCASYIITCCSTPRHEKRVKGDTRLCRLTPLLKLMHCTSCEKLHLVGQCKIQGQAGSNGTEGQTCVALRV